jgi:hypothetical protein
MLLIVKSFVSDLRQVGGTPVSSTNKIKRHDITEILLKVALNTINQPKSSLVKVLSTVIEDRIDLRKRKRSIAI